MSLSLSTLRLRSSLLKHSSGALSYTAFPFILIVLALMGASAPGMWTADEIARLCYAHYSVRLPKQGKPEPKREWTLLAAVVKIQSPANQACDTTDKGVPGETVLGWLAGNYGVRCFP